LEPKDACNSPAVWVLALFLAADLEVGRDARAAEAAYEAPRSRALEEKDWYRTTLLSDQPSRPFNSLARAEENLFRGVRIPIGALAEAAAHDPAVVGGKVVADLATKLVGNL
jgi:hypothetical protein